MHRDALLTRWTEIADRLTALAQAVPDAQYDFRPTPDVRTVAEQLRHVAFWNEQTRLAVRCEPADGSANTLPADRYPGKREVLDALRASFDGVAGELRTRDGSLDAAGQDAVISAIEHGGEHYGQLVVYARLRGMVPPASAA